MNLVLNLADNSNQACSHGNGPYDIMTPKSGKKKNHQLSISFPARTNNWHVNPYTHICVYTHSCYIFKNV